jgi:DDE superfamily endonuclease
LLTLEIPANDFENSWCWLMKFRARKGLGLVLLCGEGAGVNKKDPELLLWLNVLYDIIIKYPAGNVYNLDETGFFHLLPRYTLLMPNEDVLTVMGKKKLKDRVTLVVCANADGSSKIPCMMIGKSKALACIVGRTWCIPYHNQEKSMDGSTHLSNMV